MIIADTNIGIWIIGAFTIIPIFVLLVVALIIKIVKSVKLAKLYKASMKDDKENEKFKIELLEAFHQDNIIKVEKEMSRLTVTVKDIDLVDGEALKNIGANGILLVGNQVKCSFKEITDLAYELLKGENNE